ncbi:iron-containing alcohol dehydrogenase family protein [Gracilibacillus thailandensis]|uniref:Iron-containing alcohol dehydrogenase n=2 Tax=Gracilibacillus thailandensis TaxID=563735 RepID=A0A6N7R5H8_9BACI|nr:iron-containing alcohol dehydrogenase family protein [Gracilibacillus thailandensis]MRI68511.1 iron-containing alcohol dehydrogenase [Gracilibacillus thailandensis]
MDTLHIKGAPNYYQCRNGLLYDLFDLLQQHQFNQLLVIHGDQSWAKVKTYFADPALPCQFIAYNGECSHHEVERIAKLTKSETTAVIGIGGGKILDIAKACGDRLTLPTILIPTLASNCAPWTPLSVFYDQNGNFQEYIIFNSSTYMLLVDPNVILDSPRAYLRAGIGDTIAKWYEADVLTRELPEKPVSLDIALYAAKLCRDVLIDEGEVALAAIDQQSYNHSFLRSIETIIMAGGMVGGFGDHYGRVSGAHSIHNGLTHLAETHDTLHGDKVAYGVLVQLAIEKRLDEVEKILPFYQRLQLPTSLHDIGVTEITEEKVDLLSKGATKPKESIHFMNVSDPNVVREAVFQLEEFIRNNERNLNGV